MRRLVRVPFLSLLALLAAPAAALPEPIRVIGRVVTLEGSAVAGATVELLPVARSDASTPAAPSAPEPAAAVTTRTGADGGFSLAAPAGLSLLRVAAAGHAATEVPLPLVEAVELPPVELGVSPAPPRAPARTAAPQTVSGRVLEAATRKPLARALVWCRSCPAHPWTWTAVDGGFRLRLAAGGDPPRVEAAAAGHRTAGTRVRDARPLVLALEPAGGLSGQVVDAAGEPLAGALVRAAGADRELGEGGIEERTAAAWSGEDGRFRLAGLRPGELYAVGASHAGHAPRQVLARAEAPGKPAAPLRLALATGGSVAGRVVDAAGRPLAAARLTLQGLPLPRIRPVLPSFDLLRGVRAAAGADGRFTFRHLEPGLYLLRAERSGFAPSGAIGVDAPAEGAVEVGDLVLAPGAALEGKVTDPRGVPVAGVRVRPASSAGREVWPAVMDEVATDAEGRFRVADLPPGALFDLWLRRDGYDPAHVEGVAAGAPVPAIELQPLERLAVRVVGAEGKPVPDATVHGIERVSDAAGLPPREAYTELGTTDAEGLVHTSASPDTFALSVQAPGHEVGRRDGVSLRPPPAGPVEVVLRRAPGVPLTGQVVDAAGRPAAGVRIGAQRLDPGDGEPPFLPAVVTDGDGAFRIEALRPGRYEIGATSRAGERASATVTVGGDEPERLTLTLAGGGVEVSGRVLAGDGTPLGEALVHLTASRGRFELAVTAWDGSFSFPAVREGAYRLAAGRRGHRGATQELHVGAQPVAALELRLEPLPVAISGRVLGLPAGDLRRVLVSAHGGAGFMVAGAVDAAGRYRLADLSPGSWEVQAVVGDRSTHAKAELPETPGETTLDLEFPPPKPTLALTGRVLVDGRPLGGAAVQAFGDPTVDGFTGPDGGFRLELAAPGSYRLVVWHAEEGIAADRGIEVGEEMEVHLELATVELAGRVVAADTGEPVPEARVEIGWSEPVFGTPYAGPRLVTDAAGGFTVRLTAGTYRFSAAKDGFLPVEAQVAVAAGGTLPVELALAPAEADGEAPP